jgi:GMP reductase
VEKSIKDRKIIREFYTVMSNKLALNYDDVYLVQNFSALKTRSDADTYVQLGSDKFKLPIIPSNMETVINENWAEWLCANGYFYVMHRFNNATIPFVQNFNKRNRRTISISTGVNQDSYDELKKIHKEKLRLDYITIDVAHGHHQKVCNMIAHIKTLFPNVYVIAGNITTPEAVYDLAKWGANAVKVGIGPGKACTTRLQTGFHVPMFTAVKKCAREATVPIIADGGVKYYGDIAKAITAGATMIMAGSLFASCIDSPAPTVNGRKVYYGSASFSAKKENKHIEGTLLELDQSVTLCQRMDEIKQSLQSSISYAGGNSLRSLKYTDYVTTK